MTSASTFNSPHPPVRSKGADKTFSPHKQNLIEVRNLHIEFQHMGGITKAVKDVSFRVAPGSSVALVGESGAGKSVVSQAIMGILPKSATITSGEILFADPKKNGEVVDIAKLEPDGKTLRKIRGGRISIIFQEPMTSLSQFHTIGNQISEALFLHRDVSKKQGRKIVEDMLDLCGFPDPAGAVERYPFELSGGLRQRAMIVMALVCHPALLIADEPTTALDVSIQAQILHLIKKLQSELDMAVLVITHDLGVVANLAEEVVVLFQGEVVERGTAETLFSRPEHPYLKALFGAVPHFDMKPGERLTPLREIEHSVLSGLAPARPPEPGKDLKSLHNTPLLEIRNLTKSFRTGRGGFWGRKNERIVKAVDNISFHIGQCESVGLVGESGCGKTTLSKMIMRALTPDKGEILFHRREGTVDLAAHDERSQDLSRAIQIVFQDPFSSLNPRMTVFDIVREPLVIHKIGDRKDHINRVRELLLAVGLDQRSSNRYPHSFSGGQRQRIGLARAMALNPELMILDEPVSALDVSIQAQILNLLKDMQTELGLSYLFISHNLAVVDYIADRILVMCHGEIVESAPREVLFQNPVHSYTRDLIAAVPYPDLERKLDYDQLGQSKGTDPRNWPVPFAVTDGQEMEYFDLGDQHKVLVQSGTRAEDLAR